MNVPPDSSPFWKLAMLITLCTAMVALFNSRLIYESGIEPKDVKMILGTVGSAVAFYITKYIAIKIGGESQ